MLLMMSTIVAEMEREKMKASVGFCNLTKLSSALKVIKVPANAVGNPTSVVRCNIE